MTNETTCKEHLTLDQLVHTMQAAWGRFRNAQLYAFCAAAPVLTWARANEADFLTYCKRNSVRGQELESLVVELMLAEDGDGEAISGERRAEYAAVIAWFADRDLCPETDPDEAVKRAIGKGRITGIARLYREKKDAQNPKAKAAKEKGQATKARRRAGTTTRKQTASGATASETLAVAPESEAEANKPEFLERRVEGDPDARQDSPGAASGIDPLEPIAPDPAPPKLGMSDEKRLRARELVERVFHPRNTVADTVNFVRAYHRLAYGWAPSDLDIGSYEQQLANMRDRLREGLNDAIRYQERIAELERENSELHDEIEALKAEFAEAA
jgi:hypothetical protein